MTRILPAALLAAAAATSPALAQAPAPAQEQPIVVEEEAPAGSSGPGSVLLGSAGGVAIGVILVAVLVTGAVAALASD